MQSLTSTCLHATHTAGRWDLHQAIYYHGGYKAVAEQLKRRPVWPAAPAITRPRQLLQQLLEAAVELGLPEGHMPSMKALRQLDRDDAAQVTAAGSWQLPIHSVRVFLLPQSVCYRLCIAKMDYSHEVQVCKSHYCMCVPHE